MTDDFELLDRWRSGDMAAADALFGRYFDCLYRFFARKSSDDVTDLVQRTLLGLVEGADRFRKASRFRTFVYAVAKHELYAHWRRQKKDQRLDFTVSSLMDLNASPTTHMAKRQEERLLLEALRRVPLELQIAVELHYWEGLTGPEIADVLEIPEGTVRSRLRRGLTSIKSELARLNASDAAMASTLSGLESWAQSLKNEALS